MPGNKRRFTQFSIHQPCWYIQRLSAYNFNRSVCCRILRCAASQLRASPEKLTSKSKPILTTSFPKDKFSRSNEAEHSVPHGHKAKQWKICFCSVDQVATASFRRKWHRPNSSYFRPSSNWTYCPIKSAMLTLSICSTFSRIRLATCHPISQSSSTNQIKFIETESSRITKLLMWLCMCTLQKREVTSRQQQ